MDNWLFPITLIPGISLLILSTSSLSITPGNEIDNLLKETFENEYTLKKKLKQLGLISQSLAGLYVAAAFLALAGFIGGC